MSISWQLATFATSYVKDGREATRDAQVRATKVEWWQFLFVTLVMATSHVFPALSATLEKLPWKNVLSQFQDQTQEFGNYFFFKFKYIQSHKICNQNVIKWSLVDRDMQ